MQAKATAKFVRTSPRKARMVIDQVRGKDVLDAIEILSFSPRAVSEVVLKTLNSAVANAQVKHGLRPENLVIKEAYADEGSTIKRWRPRAKGSASPINKRTSHITIVVSSREEG